MKAIQFSAPGGPDTIAEVDIPAPVPAPGQIAIAVRFAGLNFVDVLARRGAPGYASTWPFVPGMEVGGEVTALGEGVTGFEVGDTVVAFTVDGGGLAGTVVAEAGLAARVPDGLALEAATTVPLTWATAVGLARAAHVTAADRILVTGASGGVGDALAAVLALRKPRALIGGTSARSAATLADAYRPAIRDADFAANARKAAADSEASSGTSIGSISPVTALRRPPRLIPAAVNTPASCCATVVPTTTSPWRRAGSTAPAVPEKKRASGLMWLSISVATMAAFTLPAPERPITTSRPFRTPARKTYPSTVRSRPF